MCPPVYGRPHVCVTVDDISSTVSHSIAMSWPHPQGLLYGKRWLVAWVQSLLRWGTAFTFLVISWWAGAMFSAMNMSSGMGEPRMLYVLAALRLLSIVTLSNYWRYFAISKLSWSITFQSQFICIYLMYSNLPEIYFDECGEILMKRVWY